MGIRSFLAKKKKKLKSLSSNTQNVQNPLLFQQTQVEELKHVFNMFDVNGDGKISKSELGSMMKSLGHIATEEEVEDMIKEVDSDGDGYIDLNEFIELNTEGVDSNKVLDDLKNAFLVYDVDRNGSISPDELQKVYKSLGEKVSIEECRTMISLVDVDGDGLVNFEEFKVMMMGNFNNESTAEIARRSNVLVET
ncbi:hypothetical protein IFM89_028996 [Coptis chinensis]|uniref:EF-hand domain-containing protein n=1 Tax=Coptis chinensis TaxID=261450 RepID=A0A835IC56_9MAGN|nr:hypothetical protein IFM89_028996 [Coptis chinensis]